MGCLRIMLALMICIMHAKPQKVLPMDFLPDLTGLLLDPKLNVFFMIAGFWAQQSLDHLRRKRVKWWPWVFYRSRCLRLWPAYWVCAVITFVLIRYAGYSVTSDRTMPEASVPEFLLFNMIPFIPASLDIFVMPDAWHRVILVFVVLQAWTLALVMPLFLLAPLMQWRLMLRGLFALSGIGLLYAYFDQKQYQGYVIIAAAYFFAGALAYEAYERWYARRQLNSLSKGVVIMSSLLLLVAFTQYNAFVRMTDDFIPNWVAVGLTWLLLPPLYLLTRKNPVDWYLSNISYTLYVSHFIVFFAFKQMKLEASLTHLLVLPGCILFAVGLHHVVEKPLEKWRRSL